MKKSKSPVLQDTVTPRLLVNLFRDSEMRTMGYIERKLERGLDEMKQFIRNENEKQTQELTELMDRKNREQTDEIGKVINDSNTVTDMNYIRREEFEKHISDPQAH